jgi:hypothetical protein
VKARPPPRVNPSPPNIHIDYSDSQVPPSEDYLYSDPDYERKVKNPQTNTSINRRNLKAEKLMTGKCNLQYF